MNTGVGRNQHLLRQGGDEQILAALEFRFADEIHRTGGQGVEYLQIQGGYQHHRQGVGRQVFLQKVNAALARHLHIHGDDVRVQLGELLAGVQGVDGIADHLDPGMRRQPCHNEIAGNQGIVHHHNADLFLRCDRHRKNLHSTGRFRPHGDRA